MFTCRQVSCATISSLFALPPHELAGNSNSLRLPPEQEQLVADTPAHVEAGGDIKGEGVDVLPGETNDARASNPAVYTAI